MTSPETVPERVNLPGPAVARLVVLLDHCHAFLDSHAAAQAELREYCSTQPYEVTTFAVIDQLAWQALLLRTHLVEQAGQDLGGGRRG